MPPEDHRGESPISAAEIEDAAVELDKTKNGFDFKDAPKHGRGLKEISGRNPAEKVSSFSERIRRAHEAGLTAVRGGRKFRGAGGETY